MNALELVDTMLETQHDAHIKAHERLKHWDGAQKSFHELLGLKKKSLDVMREMGTAISYERALAYAGLTREDVDHPIYGGHIGATHNYKGTEKALRCRNPHCNPMGKYDYRQRTDGNDCGNCGEPKVEAMVPISPSRLRSHYERHMLGVVTQDGRYVWFNEPVPPKSSFAV